MTRFQFLVRRLQQHTKYEVVVQAVNTHGEGPLSPVTVAQTREAGEATVIALFCSLEENRDGNEPSQFLLESLVSALRHDTVWVR